MDLFRGSTSVLPQDDARAVFEKAFASEHLDGKSVLFIIPDSTRSFPSNFVFTAIHGILSGKVRKLDFLIALGTHRAMSDEAINSMLGVTAEEMRSTFSDVRIFNHRWDDPDALRQIGIIGSARIAELTDGRFAQEVPVAVNRMLFDYDRIIIVGPVFPHEVVGFSGGHKYIFPGVGGADFINFFHWFAAVITSPKIIGNRDTPVRALIEEAASMLPFKVAALCLSVVGSELMGVSWSDSAYNAWTKACELSRQLHIVYCKSPYKSVLACAPPMYDELWTGGKCAYKTECVVADGGEIVIFAPHIKEVSFVHGKIIDMIGYHTRDYFLAQWDRFRNYPWGVIAHSTHVKGIGTYENGVDRPRINVKLATGIPRERCERINLGWVDYRNIDKADWQGKTDRLCLSRAGEILYRLEDPPAWQKL
ncbi:MAG: lactate racemase domain-containing protein [Spirochaetaceae bacterium]|nr:lactate racemase domain-containing protein [Spirochaetaceae bacterium]